MYAPAQDDEITGLVRYVDQQLAAIRASAHGLTEQQARETPCRSALSIGGIVKHTGHADIVREQIDGVAVPALVMTLEGARANDFFEPYRPAAGTLLT